MITPEAFRELLLLVLGQMFHAAGYALESSPIHWSGGLFRFERRRESDSIRRVEYQALLHAQTASRFQVTLTPLPGGTSITLPRLLWDSFGVRVLPEADHWWSFCDVADLSDGLLESGKLLAGYGLPWLDGSLVPPASISQR